MPTYPTGVYAPATKSNGQTITAAMFNDPDAEIIAVENALLNGIAHAVTVSTGGFTVSTGNVTFGQNLSVAGGSTIGNGLVVSSGAVSLGGTLQVTGNSTFSGNVTFTGTVTGAQSTPRVHLTIGADQNLASTVFTGLSWPTETFDSHGMHSTAVNSSRITFADSTGSYLIGASVDITNASSGVFRVRILLDDSTASVVAANGFFANVLPAFNVPLSVSGLARIASTATYATVQVFNGAGASTNSVTSTGSFATAFWAHKVSS